MSKLKMSKTTYWKMRNGEVVSVDQLPQTILQHIEIFDAMREDLTDIKYQEQVYSIALATKKQQIEQILSGLLEHQTQPPSDEVAGGDSSDK